jgi:hypothetical protein
LSAQGCYLTLLDAPRIISVLKSDIVTFFYPDRSNGGLGSAG